MAGKVVPAELNHGAQLEASAVLPPSTHLRKLGDPSKQLFLDALPSHLGACFQTISSSAASTSPPGAAAAAAAAATTTELAQGSSGPKCIVVCGGALRCCALVAPLRKLSKRLQKAAEAAGSSKKAPEKPVSVFVKEFKYESMCERERE